MKLILAPAFACKSNAITDFICACVNNVGTGLNCKHLEIEVLCGFNRMVKSRYVSIYKLVSLLI